MALHPRRRDRGDLYLGADNTLYYPQSGASIGAQRAFFKLDGITADDLANGIKHITLTFSDGEAVKGVVKMGNGE